MLDKNSKIYVAGHHGLVGSAIWNNLKSRGYNNLIGRSHNELDLTDQNAVKKFFDEERPDAVVLAAAFAWSLPVVLPVIRRCYGAGAGSVLVYFLAGGEFSCYGLCHGR